MAYTRTPMMDTDQNKSIPLMNQWQTRNISNSKDVDNVNVVWDVVDDPQGKYFEAIKREGADVFIMTDPPPTDTWGCWSSKSLYNGYFVTVGSYGTRLYGSSGNLLGSSTTILWNNNQIGFTEFLYQNGTVVLIISDGQNLGMMNSAGAVTAINDPDRPAIHNPYPVFLDGYLFISDAPGNIYNSDLNDPTAWSPSSFIAADGYPDRLMALARMGPYIVAFGEQSIQYYLDAGNPTGTPLALYTAAAPRLGFRGGLINYGESLIFVGLNNNGSPSVFKMTGFKCDDIGMPSVARRLDKSYQFGSFFRTGHILAINGHNLYTWSDHAAAVPQPYSTTYMLDLDTGMWSRLAFSTGRLMRASAQVETITEFFTAFFLRSDTTSYKFNPDIGVDVSGDITVQFQTPKEDFGTRRNKFGTRLFVASDKAAVSTLCSVQWSDDDYQTWSAARTVDLSTNFPCLYQLGQFRTRAHRITYTGDQPMRWRRLEMDYQQGQA